MACRGGRVGEAQMEGGVSQKIIMAAKEMEKGKGKSLFPRRIINCRER